MLDPHITHLIYFNKLYTNRNEIILSLDNLPRNELIYPEYYSIYIHIILRDDMTLLKYLLILKVATYNALLKPWSAILFIVSEK